MIDDHTATGVRSEEARPAGDELRPPELRGPYAWYARLSRRARMGLWLAFLVWMGAGALLLNWQMIIDGGPDPAPASTDRADLMLLVVDGQPGQRPAMALLHSGQEDATVVLLAPGTVVEVPGLGPKPLVGALSDGGLDALATSVANELQVRVPRTLHGTTDDMARLVDAMGGVQVEVPATVELEEEGILRRLWSRGSQRMDGATYARFMTMPIGREPELERLIRQDAAYRGLFRSLRGSKESPEAPLAGWSGDLGAKAAAGLLDEVARADDLQVLSLPVVRQAIPQEQLYRVDLSEMDTVRDRLESVRTLGNPQGRRIRLLIGADGAIGPVIGRQLIESGYRIVATEAASQYYDVTRVVIPLDERDRMQTTAERLLETLGTGRIAYERHNSTYFDANVVVGRDWAEAHGFPQSTPAPTPGRRR
jgi:hypothetical protein